MKRAGTVAPDGVSLLGDDPAESTDSRQFGRALQRGHRPRRLPLRTAGPLREAAKRWLLTGNGGPPPATWPGLRNVPISQLPALRRG